MNICVFGAASNAIEGSYLKTVEEFGAELAKKGHGLVFGGGATGLMGAVARGVAGAGGFLLGVAPHFFNTEGVLYQNCTEFIYTDTMRERKQTMEDRSDAVVMVPGGIGTFEEFFEVLTLKQLGRHQKPIVIYNYKGYYTPMLQMMETAIRDRFMAEDTDTLYSVAETEEEVFAQLADYKAFDYNKYGRK